MKRGSDIINHKSFYIIFLNSTILFVLSYFFMNLILDISTCLVANRFYYIESVLYYFGILFSIADGNPLWTVESVTVIYFTGPFIVLFLFGASFLKLISYFKNEEGILKLFFMWGVINALNLFFGGFLTGLINRRGFGYFASWNYFSVELSIFCALICVCVLVLAGFFFTGSFMRNANNYMIINKKNRRSYIFNIAVYPWIAGLIIITLLKVPGIRGDEILIYLCLAIFLIPVLTKYKKYPDISEEVKRYPENFPGIDEKQSDIKLSKSALIIFFIALIAYRIVLSYGIPFNVIRE